MMVEYYGIKIIPNASELFEFIIKLNKILSNEIPLQYRLILLYTKFDLLNEIIVRSRSKTYFNLLLETHNEFERLLLQNYNHLKKDESFPLDYCDILIHQGFIALIYYMFHDIKNTLLYFEKRRRCLDLYPVPEYIKIGILFNHFQFFEDYSDLREINKVCINYSPDDSIDFSDIIIKGVCEFSSFFSEKKGDLLEILNFIKDQIIISQPIVKNIIEIEASEIFIGVFYHIINATKQDSTLLLVSEVEKALELAKQQNETNDRLTPYDYYLLKTQAIEDILNANLDEVKKTVSKLDSYEFKTKDDFKNAMILWLDSTLGNYGKNIDILSKLKDVDDPWCNLIHKIIKEKIRQSSYYQAKSDLDDVKKLTNVTEQLLEFKHIVERNCINAFWKSRINGILKPQPEEIGKSLLVTFFYACDFYSH
ncbi:MAG: hypothetical protein KAT05_05600, partial [Spirochaetes bacterium]|nr:hypothetical protein [Spirochaetota bacterium]